MFNLRKKLSELSSLQNESLDGYVTEETNTDIVGTLLFIDHSRVYFQTLGTQNIQLTNVSHSNTKSKSGVSSRKCLLVNTEF